MRNRIRLLVIALLAVLSLAACGNEGSGTATVNMKQLQQAMLAAAPSLSETASTTGDAADAKETFSYVSDLPYDKVENFLLSYSTTGKADEIAVIAVKDPADVTKAADSLRAHVESRRKLFLQYGPAEAARVEKAQVFTKDQYAVLIICDDSPAVKTARCFDFRRSEAQGREHGAARPPVRDETGGVVLQEGIRCFKKAI